MIRYAAITPSGKRHYADTRDEVDAWAKQACRDGEEVEVYSAHQLGGNACNGASQFADVVRVGMWRPLSA